MAQFKITILILFLFSLILPKTYAEENKFAYKIDKDTKESFSLDVYNLITHFEQFNFEHTNPFPNGTIPGLYVDEVLHSNNGSGLIFIKKGLITEEKFQKKILKMVTPNTKEEFFVFNTDRVSVAFFNLSEREVQLLIKNLETKKTSHFIGKFFIENAYSDIVNCQKKTIDINDNLYKTANGLENNLILNKISDCALNAFKGAKNQVTSTYNFFKSLVDDPATLWEKVKKNYQEMKHFILNFQSEMTKIYETLSDLDLDQKLEIACTMTGEAASTFLMSLTGVGAGVGVGKIIATYIPKLRKLQEISKTFKNHKLKFKKTKELLSCEI